MLVNGINHVAILTEDVDRFCAFYAEVFGASVVFAETTPAFRHAILSVGGGGVLHPVEVAGNAHGRASSAMLDRGHLDHFALNVPSREAFDVLRERVVEQDISDGVVTDLGPKLSFWFTDPDGAHVEVDWVRDASLAGFHAPVVVPDVSQYPSPMPVGVADGGVGA
jgi:catechol 2,3-dioxygenase-like lactoylglutathione lyase family enzyme